MTAASLLNAAARVMPTVANIVLMIALVATTIGYRRTIARLYAAVNDLALDRHRDTTDLATLRETLSDRERRVRALELALSVAAAERDEARDQRDASEGARGIYYRQHAEAVRHMRRAERERDALQARWDHAHPPMLRGPGGKMVGRADRVVADVVPVGDGQTGSQAGVDGSPAGEEAPQHPHSAPEPGDGPVAASVEAVPDARDAADSATFPTPVIDIADPDFGTGRYHGLTRGDDAGQAGKRDGEGV